MNDTVEEALRVEPKASIAEYSWDELKEISRAIAAAGCQMEGLTIARVYHLVDDKLKLRGDTKRVVLEDGTTEHVRILGFCHDLLADGTGKAGISFEFADIPTVHCMNPRLSNKGGWHSSEMRDWLNTVFFGMLPQDLSSNIAEVEKKTHYRDWDNSSGEASFVAGSFDKLWLLSMSEVYGSLSAYQRAAPQHPAEYDEEGTQYHLYSNNDVSVINYELCRKKSGVESCWWLRSPTVYDSWYFHLVDDSGDWSDWVAGGEIGVSPGFCF